MRPTDSGEDHPGFSDHVSQPGRPANNAASLSLLDMQAEMTGLCAMGRIQRAMELRHIAIAVVKARGRWHEMRSGPHLLIYHDEVSKLTITYRSPSRTLPGDAPTAVPHPGLPSFRNLPYGIEVFQGRKMLNVEWADDGGMNILGYTPGSWEGDLSKLAA